MNERARALAKKIEAFNDEVITFVEGCSDGDWATVTEAEDWPAGVVARHIAAGHYGAVALARIIIDGAELPKMTPQMIVDMANQHAREHADCTREEVLGLLRSEGPKLVRTIASWSDEEFDRASHLDMMGKPVGAGEFMELVVLASAGDHLKSIRAATRR